MIKNAMRPPDLMRVRDLMSQNPVTLGEDDDLDVAETAMQIAHVHHLPVVRGQHPVGVVSDRDLLRVSLSILADLDETEHHRLLSAVPVRLVMNRTLALVSPDLDASDAGDQLLAHPGDCLLVVEEDLLVGIVTETDFVRLSVELLRRRSHQPQLPASP
jgi:CBS domain-containing membrane protein